MDLHGIAKGAVAAVNPQQRLSLQRSTGYTTNAAGRRTPSYAAPVVCYGQVQSLTYKDIQQINGLNLQGTRRAIYLEGHWDGLVRNESKGGDLITDGRGDVWLVALVLESWPDWTKVAVTLQIDNLDTR